MRTVPKTTILMVNQRMPLHVHVHVHVVKYLPAMRRVKAMAQVVKYVQAS